LNSSGIGRKGSRGLSIGQVSIHANNGGTTCYENIGSIDREVGNRVGQDGSETCVTGQGRYVQTTHITTIGTNVKLVVINSDSVGCSKGGIRQDVGTIKSGKWDANNDTIGTTAANVVSIGCSSSTTSTVCLWETNGAVTSNNITVDGETRDTISNTSTTKENMDKLALNQARNWVLLFGVQFNLGNTCVRSQVDTYKSGTTSTGDSEVGKSSISTNTSNSVFIIWSSSKQRNQTLSLIGTSIILYQTRGSTE
jgi:hypothetical protein